jgi:hypothetical protein
MSLLTSNYRPSKRPSVNKVDFWDILFEETTSTWRGPEERYAKVENGRPFPDFYRVTFIDENKQKSSKLFYGETAWSDTERYVYDLGFFNVLGAL